VARAVRVALAEKGLEAETVAEEPWAPQESFLALSPDGAVPVLEDGESAVINGCAIFEYLEETRPDPALLPGSPVERAEIRRLSGWFLHKFDREVTDYLVGERLVKRLGRFGTPDAVCIRAGLANIHYHLDYIEFLAARRTWLAGGRFSLADIAAGVQLSLIDFLGSVPWAEHPEAKDWYARIKSRPSFRTLLCDTLPGMRPPSHYADLDF